MESIHDLSFGKMYPEPSPAIKEKISDVSLSPSVKSKKIRHLSLDLQNGQIADGSWVEHSLSLGECWTLGIFESPKDAEESFLSQILMNKVPEKYYLTKKACQGNIKASGNERETTTDRIGKSTTLCLNDQGGQRMDVTQEFTSTLRAKGNRAPYVFENHGQDVRYKGPLDTIPTLGANLGTGGNNQPLVVEPKTYDIRLTSENTRNVRANVYETDVSRTIDTGGNNPDRNQGGLAVVYSTSKNSHHTVANTNEVGTLVSSDYKDPPTVCERNFKVRRLTPTECGRLQGFPDEWCKNLEIPNPSEEELDFWKEVFEEHRIINGKVKSKSDKQILKWLNNPYSDTAEYKMWGNGVALSCVEYIMKKLSKIMNK